MKIQEIMSIYNVPYDRAWMMRCLNDRYEELVIEWIEVKYVSGIKTKSLKRHGVPLFGFWHFISPINVQNFEILKFAGRMKIFKKLNMFHDNSLN